MAEIRHKNERVYGESLLKESFLDVFTTGDGRTTERRLREWLEWDAAHGSDVRAPRRTVRKHLDGISPSSTLG